MPIFNLNYDDIPNLIEILEDALLERPEPDDTPYYDLDEGICNASEYAEAIEDLSDPYIELDIFDFEEIIQKMVNGYRSLWEHPFPKGLEEGQYLFSALLEKPLKDLLRNLKYIQKNQKSNNKPLISLDAEKEADAFSQWQQKALMHYKEMPSSPDLSCLIGATLFGYWLGKD